MNGLIDIYIDLVVKVLLAIGVSVGIVVVGCAAIFGTLVGYSRVTSWLFTFRYGPIIHAIMLFGIALLSPLLTMPIWYYGGHERTEVMFGGGITLAFAIIISVLVIGIEHDERGDANESDGDGGDTDA